MIEDYDENGTHKDTRLLFDLMGRISAAKVAFNVPVGDSTRTDDDDYLADVGRMVLEMLNLNWKVGL